MTPATAQEDTINKMWSEYMKESGEYDKRVTDVWRKDASDILIFVSPKYNGSTRLS
jgi:NAD(P)H-dependent FMN reductase